MYKIPISFDSFKTSTGLNGKPKHRGANILTIDLAFQDYEARFANADTNLQVSLTLNLYKVCTDWLKLKRTKPTVTGKLIKTVNKNLIKRRTAISGVAKHCVNSLRNAHQMHSGKASMNLRKVDMLAKGTAGIQATPLSGDFGTERKTWVGSGKTVSIAGHFHVSQGEIKNLGMNQANFNGMSEQEYSAFLNDANNKLRHVLYFNKDTRATTLMDFGDDGLTFRPGSKELMDCRLPAFNLRNPNDYIGGLWMYAMDSYGNLLSMPTPEFEKLKSLTGALGQNAAKVTNFNHSSFNAGREVISAGLIGFTDGFITWIDNNSGHYKPTRNSLKDAVEFMADEGRNLTRLMVAAYHYEPNGNIRSIQVHSADHFLVNVDAMGDITSI